MRFLSNPKPLSSHTPRLAFAAWALFALPLAAQSPLPIAQQQSLGELIASEPGAPAGSQPVGTPMSVLPGSVVSAGIAPATLKLARGGLIRVCPKSSMNVNSAAQGLVVGMNAGSMEIDYRLEQGAADMILTPDFNLRLVGPAAYHFALSSNSKGDTCIKTMAGNGAGILLTELMGSDSYGVAAGESALFRGGRIANRTALTDECGCPEPALPTVQTASSSDRGSRPEINAPFVFSATAAGDSRPNVIARLNVSSLPNVFFPQEDPVPVVLIEKRAEVSINRDVKPKTEPEPQTKKEKKGIVSRVKGFFGSVFHR